MTNPLAHYRELFPATRRFAYFNVAANAPLPSPVSGAIRAYVTDLAEYGAVHYRSWFDAYQETRVLAARLIGASPDEVAFVRNTSEGMNVVANGLGLEPGDSIVLVRGDFPANVHPWKNLEGRGVVVRMVEPDGEGRVTPDQILAACDASTRLVSVSFVSYATGFRVAVSELGRRLRERGILFFLDAIQGLGQIPLDVTAAHVDFLAADAHKWLLCPEGIGIFYVRRERLDALRMTFVSWLSMKDPFEAETYARDLRDDARRFEFATPNTMGIFALRAALGLLGEAGIDRIEHHVLALSDAVADGIARRGFRVRSPRGAEERSGIVAFDRPGADLKALERDLLHRGVVVANRAGMLRVAAHFYNDASDVARLVDALPGS